MSCRGSSALRWSFRLASRRFGQEGTRRAANTSVLFRQNVESLTSFSPIKSGSLGIVQARFSSSDNSKCTEHKVEDCKKCVKDVSFDELTALMKDVGSLRLVDVRESYELREAGRIPHAVNIPLGQLQKVLQMKDEDFEHIFKIKKPKKDEEIIFSCKMGPRSNVAMKIAEAMGYTKARHYPGGWQEWSKMQGDRV